MKLSHYLPIIAIAAMFASCSQQGATGPAGPTGPQGPTGVANIYTQEYTVTSSSWTDPSSNTTWIATGVEPDITDNNNDAVVVYWSNSGSGWLAMPATNLLGDNDGDELSYGFNDNSITFSYYDGSGPAEPPSFYTAFQTLYFKVTVIPPAVQHKYPGTNWQNASEVQKIPEVQTALNNANNK